MNNNNDDIRFVNTTQTQQEFEDSMESVEEVVYKTQCSKCGKTTVDECTVDYCEEPTCEFEQLGELFYSPGYREVMIDPDTGEPVRNFLGVKK